MPSMSFTPSDTIVIDDGEDDVIIIIANGDRIEGNVTVAPTSVSNSAFRSVIADIDVPYSGNEVELCFWTALGSGEDINDASLVYYDESEDCFEVEDDSLEERDTRVRNGVEEVLLCGTTDHFTTFGVLLGGEDELGSGTNGICGSVNGGNTVIIILSGAIAGTFLIIIIVVIILTLFVANFRYLMLGSEAQRVEKLRMQSTFEADEAADEPSTIH